MPKFTTRLTNKKEVAVGTMEFLFEKPLGISFKAGNNFDWTLINPPETDKEGDTRTFSNLSAPFENYLGFATRMRDTAFKRVLKNMNPGTEIQLEGPFGSFTLHDNSARKAIFLVGGIGITPFMSIVRDAAHNKLPHKIFLFYSNRRVEDAAYLGELTSLEQENPNYKLIAALTKPQDLPQEWKGETGYITIEMIKKYIPDFSGSLFYSAGPPEMVRTMRKMLEDAGVYDEDIKTEDFAGY